MYVCSDPCHAATGSDERRGVEPSRDSESHHICEIKLLLERTNACLCHYLTAAMGLSGHADIGKLHTVQLHCLLLGIYGSAE